MHFGDAVGNATGYDRAMHRLADGVCVSFNCCIAKYDLVYAFWTYFGATQDLDDARIDYEDYEDLEQTGQAYAAAYRAQWTAEELVRGKAAAMRSACYGAN